MSTNIYKFADGRLLVKESRKVESNYQLSGVPVRIGQVRRVEDVIALDNDFAKYGLLTPLSEARVSNNQIFVVMRRGDLGPMLTSGLASGAMGFSLTSGIGSGLTWLSELRSGGISGGAYDWEISGKVTVTATIVGY